MSDGRKGNAKRQGESNQPGKRKFPMSSPDVPQRTSQPTQHPPLPPLTQGPLTSFQIPSVSQQPRTLQEPTPKIAIPRLRRGSEGASAAGSSAVGDKHRVSHACEPCRHRKTKCSGERPICKHCEDFRINCTYADGKRDRTKKEFGSMANRVEECEKLLRELSQRVSITDQTLIRKALEKVGFATRAHPRTPSANRQYKETSPDVEDRLSYASSKNVSVADGGVEQRSGHGHGESQVTARVGSTGSLDLINEDFNRSAATRATGFMGKSAEITWMQRLKRQQEVGSESGEGKDGEDNPTIDGGQASLSFAHELKHLNDTLDSKSEDAPPVSESTYHCDDLTVLIPDRVDPFEIPPKHTAAALYQSYLETVHPAFPILGKVTFTNQFYTFLNNEKINTGPNWLAILNLIFAIAAKYSHLVQAEWRGDERDHLIYFTRARMLGFNGETILFHAELQRVQITGLMAFYLMAISQINRSWSINGIAIRYAITLGLNLRNENKKVSESSKEIRYRVWWAMCSTERILAVMTGRPTSFLQSDCTALLPSPVDEESIFIKEASNVRRDSSGPETVSSPSSSTSATKTKVSPGISFSPVSHHSASDKTRGGPPNHAMYFMYHTKLSILTNEVLDRLYRAGVIHKSWEAIQINIANLVSKLEQWHSELPPVFDFIKKQRDQQFVRQRMSLGFFYYSTLMITNRPCLCRIGRKIPNESQKSIDFNLAAAVSCVYAAKDMMEVLPEEPNPVGLYKVAPWWCIVHHLVQAAVVLMLELSMHVEHLPHEADEILETARKAIYWLKSMSQENLAAHRAWRLCDDTLQKVATMAGRNVVGLPSPSFTSTGEMEQPMATPAAPQGMTATQIYAAQFSDASYYATMQPENSFIQPTMYAIYDELSSPGQLPASIPSSQMSNMFTIPNEMDGVISEEAQDQMYPSGYDQP